MAGRERREHELARLELQSIHRLAERHAVERGPGARILLAVVPVVLAGDRRALERIAVGRPQLLAENGNPVDGRAGLGGDAVELGRGEIGVAAAEPEVGIDGQSAAHAALNGGA